MGRKRGTASSVRNDPLNGGTGQDGGGGGIDNIFLGAGAGVLELEGGDRYLY